MSRVSLFCGVLLVSALAGCADPGLENTYLAGGEEGALRQTVRLQACFDVDDPTKSCTRCAAALLGPRTVITAAHCVLYDDYERQEVSVWSYFTGEQIAVADIVEHPSFSSERDPLGFREDYDVAMLRLERPVDIGMSVTPYMRLASDLPTSDLLWVNGTRLDGEFLNWDQGSHAVVHLEKRHSQYEIKIDTINFILPDPVLEGGDSGGPAFLESEGEADDGVDGWSRPTLHGVNTRKAYLARIDPISDWILERLAEFEATPLN